MKREFAIDLVARAKLPNLSEVERSSHVWDWWAIDEADSEFSSLPEALKALMKSGTEPQDLMSQHLDVLVLVALRFELRNVTNRYLSMQVKMLGRNESVDGEEPTLVACACCGYLCFEATDSFGICSVCFWQQDSTSIIDGISAPNKMSLSEAQQNFRRVGAISEKFLRSRPSDVIERFNRNGIETA
jgi:hypothetical protein